MDFQDGVLIYGHSILELDPGSIIVNLDNISISLIIFVIFIIIFGLI